ncbi:MAG: nucleotidyltransferase domain-containing protein [Planctomycetes bacterium]|nr:nucleotidyltransferase domain-containing protein [Planctomycetota bacterium]
MIALIEKNRLAIEELCREYRVARLEVFGSAAAGGFDESRSDVDFLVTYRADHDLGPWLGEYFDLKADLETLLGRRVDLVMAGAVKNPRFLREVERTRTLLYAA